MKLKEWLVEVRRKSSHCAVGLLTLAIIVLIPERLITKLGAALLVFLAGLHWYVSKRYQRRQKFREALVDLKKNFGEELTCEEKQNFKELYNKEETFFRKIIGAIGRRNEEIVMPAFYFFFGCLMSYLLFGKYALVFGIMGWAAGDVAATLIGKQFGRHKIQWNKNKSWEGFAAFAIVTAIAVFIFLSIAESYIRIDVWKIMLLTALAGALVETAPVIEDNVTIPFVISFVMWLAYHASAWLKKQPGGIFFSHYALGLCSI